MENSFRATVKILLQIASTYSSLPYTLMGHMLSSCRAETCCVDKMSWVVHRGLLCPLQAMTDCTGALVDESWRYSGRRDIYADLNALTLKITTQALFGDDLPPAEGVKVTGEPRLHHSFCCSLLWPFLRVVKPSQVAMH